MGIVEDVLFAMGASSDVFAVAIKKLCLLLSMAALSVEISEVIPALFLMTPVEMSRT